MRKKSLTKEQREIQIINIFQSRIKDDNWNPASLSEIARRTGLSPSSHLRKILEEMVNNGLLVPVTIERSGRWTGRGYIPSREHFKKPERTAIVNFTQNGKKYRLEMLL